MGDWVIIVKFVCASGFQRFLKLCYCLLAVMIAVVRYGHLRWVFSSCFLSCAGGNNVSCSGYFTYFFLCVSLPVCTIFKQIVCRARYPVTI